VAAWLFSTDTIIPSERSFSHLSIAGSAFATASKFNSRLVVPTSYNIESHPLVANATGDGIRTLLGVVVRTADFKFCIESGKVSPSEPMSIQTADAVKLA
jgi:hypothetical protein